MRVPQDQFALAEMGKTEFAPVAELAGDIGAGGSDHRRLAREEDLAKKNQRQYEEGRGQPDNIAARQWCMGFYPGFDDFLSYCHLSCFDA